MELRTVFRFTLPRGTGLKAKTGSKVTGVMRLVKVKDIVEIQRDGAVKKDTAEFYKILLNKVVTELGTEKMITRKTIEALNAVDFTFLVDFLHQINHQVISRIPIKCQACGKQYLGEIENLGEA